MKAAFSLSSSLLLLSAILPLVTPDADYRAKLKTKTSLRHLAIEIQTGPSDGDDARPECGDVMDLICHEQEVFLCAPINGTFAPIYVETCSGFESCVSGECKHQFPCTDVGLFPDPYDCKAFHVCHPDSDALDLESVAFCEGNYGYNPKSTYCDRKLAGGKCGDAYPVPICEHFGQSGPLPENRSVYYVCVYLGDTDVLYPYLFLCPNGRRYSGQFQCV